MLLYGQVPGREAIATIEADSTVEERPFGAALAESLHSGFSPRARRENESGQKNAGLKAVTLIATLNPVSQVLW